MCPMMTQLHLLLQLTSKGSFSRRDNLRDINHVIFNKMLTENSHFGHYQLGIVRLTTTMKLSRIKMTVPLYSNVITSTHYDDMMISSSFLHFLLTSTDGILSSVRIR